MSRLRSLSDFLSPKAAAAAPTSAAIRQERIGSEPDDWYECEERAQTQTDQNEDRQDRSSDPQKKQESVPVDQPEWEETGQTELEDKCSELGAPSAPSFPATPAVNSPASTPGSMGKYWNPSYSVRSASPVGAGSPPSKSFGFQAPHSPRQFTKCWSQHLPNSPASSSSARPQKPARPSLGNSSNPAVVQELKDLLASSIAGIQKLGLHRHDIELEVFKTFLRAMTKASSMLRDLSPESVLGDLESKGLVLHFVVDIHTAKKMYRRQTSSVWTALLQSDTWLWTLHQDPSLLAKLPEDLASLIPRRKPVTPPPGESLGLPQTPPSKTNSPTRQAAVEADAQAAKERRNRRATRRGVEPLHELLLASAAQLEALDFSAEGDADEVAVAFETFLRAVRQVVRSEKTVSDSREVLEAVAALERYEPKARTLHFLAAIADRRKIYRSRAIHLLSQLAALQGWHELIAAMPIVQTLQNQDTPLAQTPSPVPSENEAPSPAAAGEEDGEPDREPECTPRLQDVKQLLEETVRPLAPWYLRVCMSIFGVAGALRKCRCLVPRSLQEQAEPLLDSVLAQVKVKVAKEKAAEADPDPPLFGRDEAQRKREAEEGDASLKRKPWESLSKAGSASEVGEKDSTIPSWSPRLAL